MPGTEFMSPPLVKSGQRKMEPRKKHGYVEPTEGPNTKPGYIKHVRRTTTMERLTGSRKEAREEEEHVLRKRKQTQVVKQTENTRLHDFRRKQYAAMRIQKAWR
ncbi:hypothetical protein MAR_036146, partial [Mya arenaria]